MTARYLRALALLLTIALLGGAGARGDDDEQDDEQFDQEPAGKLAPWTDTGGHCARVGDMAFGRLNDDTLYTVGPPGDVHEWDTQTGERLRVWRFDRNANRLAVTPNGKYLAVGGFAHRAGKAAGEVPVWLINLHSGAVTAKNIPGTEYVSRLAFDHDGKRLAAGSYSKGGNLLVIQSVEGGGKRLQFNKTGFLTSMTFDKSGRWLAAGWHNRGGKQASGVRLIDTKGKGAMLSLPDSSGPGPCVAFGPTGRRLVSITGGDSPSVRVWAVSDKPAGPQITIDDKVLRKALGEKGPGLWYPIGVSFRAKGDIIAAWEQGGWVRLFRINADTKSAKLLAGDLSRQSHFGGVAIKGDWFAVGTNPGYRIALYQLSENRRVAYRNPFTDQKELSFGPAVVMPRHVAWMPKEYGYGIVWTAVKGKAKEVDWGGRAQGLNLSTLERIGKEDRAKAVHSGDLPKNWTLERDKQRNVYLTAGKKAKVKIDLKDPVMRLIRAYRVKKDVRLLVPYDNALKLAVVDPATGKKAGDVGTYYFPLYDLAASPDQKYLLVAGGDQQVRVYDLANPRRPLLQVLARGQDWVAWTNEGYFAGTPNGEKFIGWKVSRPDQLLASFYPAAAFRRRMYRPDVIKELLPTGSVEVALKKAGPGKASGAGAQARSIEDLEPPQVTITKAEKDPKNNRQWTITAVVQAADQKKQRVESLKLLVEGSALPNNQSVQQLKPGQKSATWVVPEMPEGDVELKVMARGPDVVGLSPTRKIEVPVAAARRPSLHVISVGLTYKGSPLALGDCTMNDAKAVHEQFPICCAGPGNYFGAAPQARLLLDNQATSRAVLDALAAVKKGGVKPRDLLVFFFAGHGANEKGEFYLLTHGSDPQNLAGTALSGKQLRKALADFPCQVLVLLDACHSGNAGKALRSPADEASRDLADEECSATLIAAAMGHERALQPPSGKHGYFTQALLEALKKKKPAVAFNRRNGHQYVNHLFSDVLDEVRDATKEGQHPMLVLPWTVEPYPLRKVP
jgi:WD40 repeat protein